MAHYTQIYEPAESRLDVGVTMSNLSQEGVRSCRKLAVSHSCSSAMWRLSWQTYLLVKTHTEFLLLWNRTIG